MPHHIFPNEFIFWTSAKNHEKNKLEISEMIEKKYNLTKNMQKNIWRCDVNTEFFDLNDNAKYTNLVVNEIYPALDKMFYEVKNLNIPKISSITNIWYNRYSKGHNQEVHSHTGHDISGIYLLELNEPNNTVFYSYPASTNNIVEEDIKSDFAKEGDIMLFPSNLLHYVLPTTKDRTTIAFNITCEF